MILEVAILPVQLERQAAFERSFAQAERILIGMKGYIGHELKKGIERKDQYILLVRWQSLEDHEVGFRKSKEYQEWKRLLHHFYNPFPEVLHYH
ncbi:antibiotic biosynthesis monooxygenase [Flagellimonas sp. DF-77]|uniref:antibiotic biosynthesis monooxygenase family protein n=1 Tax=Flagellimonas algarum TaxID=3230298 RepID=UPI00339A8541